MLKQKDEEINRLKALKYGEENKGGD